MTEIQKEIKHQILQSLYYLYSFPIYPIQHKDILQAYSMGWMDSFKHYHEKYFRGIYKKDIYHEAVELFRPFSEKDWFPDESWNWWTIIPSQN